MLAGEPGIGKTRLATEALTLAGSRGFITLRSTAYPLQTDLGYAPVLEAFSRLSQRDRNRSHHVREVRHDRRDGGPCVDA
ncbi:MAG TPA: hypothetical protein VIU11_22405 [Nakamurella sp.]